MSWIPTRCCGGRLRWAPPARDVWVEGTSGFAWRQTRLSPGDLSDARIGATRSRGSIARFFDGKATELGLVEDGRLVETGETLAQVQDRVLGPALAAPFYTSTPGFVVLGARAGWQVSRDVEFVAIADNLTDRNYRLHGSGVDGPGVNVQLRMRYRF